MAIIVKASKNQSTNDLIRKFKKRVGEADVVGKTRERRYYKKPSQERADSRAEMRRLRKRARSLKRMKNISPRSLERINERLNS